MPAKGKVMMKIKFNSNQIDVQSQSTVKEVLHSQGIFSNKGVAVALNQAVLAFDLWENTKLKENDALIVITATAGG